ncbi:MAG: YccF domain-containing protein [Desulfosalsimonadaceae bacterium]
MAFVGNVLWFVFGGGIVAWFFWVVSGILLAVTIVGLPFAVAAFRIAGVDFQKKM